MAVLLRKSSQHAQQQLALHGAWKAGVVFVSRWIASHKLLVATLLALVAAALTHLFQSRKRSERPRIPEALQGLSSNRKITISINKIILWNPSEDPEMPNYAFVESTLGILSSLVERFDVYLIMMVASETETKTVRRLLAASGVFPTVDDRKLLFCSSEEGKSHMIRHIGPFAHLDCVESSCRGVAQFVPKVFFIHAGLYSQLQSQKQQQQKQQQQHHIIDQHTAQEAEKAFVRAPRILSHFISSWQIPMAFLTPFTGSVSEKDATPSSLSPNTSTAPSNSPSTPSSASTSASPSSSASSSSSSLGASDSEGSPAAVTEPSSSSSSSPSSESAAIVASATTALKGPLRNVISTLSKVSSSKSLFQSPKNPASPAPAPARMQEQIDVQHPPRGEPVGPSPSSPSSQPSDALPKNVFVVPSLAECPLVTFRI